MVFFKPALGGGAHISESACVPAALQGAWNDHEKGTVPLNAPQQVLRFS